MDFLVALKVNNDVLYAFHGLYKPRTLISTRQQDNMLFPSNISGVWVFTLAVTRNP